MVVEARNLIIGVKDYCILAVMPLLVLICCKQNMDQSPTKVTGDEQIQITMEEVQQAVSIFNEAMVNPTVELMDDLCADQLTYGHSSGLIQNKSEFIDDIVNGPCHFMSLEAADLSIHISVNTAIVRHIFLAKGTNAGEPVDVRIGNV